MGKKIFPKAAFLSIALIAVQFPPALALASPPGWQSGAGAVFGSGGRGVISLPSSNVRYPQSTPRFELNSLAFDLARRASRLESIVDRGRRDFFVSPRVRRALERFSRESSEFAGDLRRQNLDHRRIERRLNLLNRRANEVESSLRGERRVFPPLMQEWLAAKGVLNRMVDLNNLRGGTGGVFVAPPRPRPRNYDPYCPQQGFGGVYGGGTLYPRPR